MFKRIVAENLFSWGKLDYTVVPGVSGIDGFNYDDNTSEGSGKSSVVNILSWVLFGKIPKDARIDEVIKQGESYALGLIELESGHKILRSRKPNDLRIINPDDSETLGKDAKETQVLIEKLIGMSFETFCQSVYFPQNYSQKFITANETDRAKILSEIQDLSIYDKARKLAHDKEKQSLELAEKARSSLNASERLLKVNLEMLERIELLISEFETKKREKIALLGAKQDQQHKQLEILTKLTNVENSEFLATQLKEAKNIQIMLNATYQELQLKSLNKKNTDKQLESLNKQFNQTISEARQIEEEMEQLQINKDACPTCGTKLAHEAHAKAIEPRINLLNKRLETALRNRDSLVYESSNLKAEEFSENDAKELQTIASEIKEINELVQDLTSKITAIAYAEKDLINLKTMISEIEIEQQKILSSDPLTEIKTQGDLQAKIQALKQQILIDTEKVLAQDRFATEYNQLRDEFKNLKSFLFSNLLAEISFKSTELASSLFEVPINIRFFNEAESGDVSKIQLEINLDNNIRSLGLLSGGQFRRVQIAVDLALSAIIAGRSEKPCNFRIFDEPCKDLSLTSMAKVVELLEGLEGSTILIEHSPLVKAIMKSTFFVEYRNGESKHGTQLV